MPRPVDTMSDAEVLRRLHEIPHWYHAIELRPGLVTPGANAASLVLSHLDLPDDCSGARALDLGARDGFFSFELERRGAEVLAVDYVGDQTTGFRVVADLLGSRVRFLNANIYELSAQAIGQFDIVLFLGLLYHLPDPLEALHLVRTLSRGRLCLESHAIDHAALLPDGSTVPLETLSPLLNQLPLMQFYPGRALNNDPTNYWGPNLACLEAMLKEALFEVRSSHLVGSRAIVNAVVTENADVAFHNALARRALQASAES